MKWILGEINKKYNDEEYHKKLYKPDLLTMHDFFVVKKLKLFRCIIYGISSIAMPDYVIHKQDSCTIDNKLNFAISSDIKQIIMTFGSSYFPSCIELWNALRYNIKSLTNSNELLVELKNHIWQQISIRYEIEPD